ncbi:hypothetical protein IL54_3436 [Sphingobium sp. ba1]|nr:hypothetical protein IL54_3436 [Sphingobium sp. ba1]
MEGSCLGDRATNLASGQFGKLVASRIQRISERAER